MLSSISSSNRTRSRARLDRFTVVLLSTFLVVLVLLEGVSRAKFDSTSRVQRREVSERRALLAVQDAPANDDPHIAVFGNSLMLEGVDLPLLKSKLDLVSVPVPYFVLGTNYYDWFFGIKRLFAEGMRPRYVLLGLSPNQLATSEIRGDISARYLIQPSDLLEISQQTHMDATRASGFVLSHFSEYYSTRDITRGYVMSRVLPGVGELLHGRYASYRDPEIRDSVLQPLAAERLAALDQLCRANGSRFLLVVPPTYQKGSETMVRAGHERGVTVLVPVSENEFDSSYYQSDGFHMNSKGAQVFTTRLATILNDELSK